MAMANAELVNGAVPISTDFVNFSTSLYWRSNNCWIKTRSMHLHLQSRVQNNISGLHVKQCAIHPFLQKKVTRSITVCG